MNLPRYTYYSSNNFKDYRFISEGSKGKIAKVVRFSKIEELKNVYNLAFGDENFEGDIDDIAITNNEHRDLVLSTVANTVIDFTNHYGDYRIYFEGSTPVRTRLYQIGISSLFDEISLYFEVSGLKDDNWEGFKKNVNYSAFLIKRI
jgi:hypothetical protein